jgi:predicted transcriptional regulator
VNTRIRQRTPGEHLERIGRSDIAPNILKALVTEPGMYVKRIAAAIDKDPRGLSTQLRVLRRAELIERTEDAARDHYTLTKVGAEVARRLLLRDGIPPATVAQVINLLDRKRDSA